MRSMLCAVLALAVAAPSCVRGLPASATAVASRPRNLILVIGDGMGPQQIGLLLDDAAHRGHPAALARLMRSGALAVVTVAPHGSLVVDSAAAASQLATGVLSGSEMIGLDRNGNPAITVLERAERAGKATGLVSDTRLTHATPAAFAAHRAHRSMENEIAVDMLERGVDVMLAGGSRHFLPRAVNEPGPTRDRYAARLAPLERPQSRRSDDRDLVAEAEARGYAVAFTRQQLAAAPVSAPLLGLFGAAGMPDGIAVAREAARADRAWPTLREMTEVALARLDRDPDGFFLMVEGGQIDWAAHGNDAGRMLHELRAMDMALAAVLAWAEGRDDTLVVVTADHETGGFGFSYSRASLSAPRPLTGEAFADQSYWPRFNFVPPAALDRLAAQDRSFERLLREFDALPAPRRTPTTLADMVRAATGYAITAADAVRVLASETNTYRIDGHESLAATEFPAIDDFESFYTYADEARQAILARVLADRQGIVWATGTHTSTPVLAVAAGPGAERLSGLMHQSELGARLQQILLGARP